MNNQQLLTELAVLIEQSKKQVVSQVNSVLTLTYWQVGRKINEHILQNKRAEYGKQIMTTVVTQLMERYGEGFNEKNLRRMMKFTDLIPDFDIVISLARQLSWLHFIILIPLKTNDARVYYAQKQKKDFKYEMILPFIYTLHFV